MPLSRSIAAGVLLLAAAACPAASQSDRYRPEAPVKPFALTAHTEEIGTEYHYFGETIKRQGGGRIRYSNHYFQNYASTQAEGYIYHPRFLEYSAKLKLGLSHQRLSRTEGPLDETSSSSDRLLGYDIRVEMFKKHPVSASLGANRDERILMGLFVDRYLVKTESQRGTVRWNTRDLQMDATATHSITEEFGADSRSRTESTAFNYNLHHQVGKRMQTDFRYLLQRYDRSYSADTINGGRIDGESELQSQTANLDNVIDFTNDRRATLRSSFRVHDQQNSSDLRSYYWQERFQAELSRNLKGYASASFLRNEYARSRTDTYRAETGLDHELFKSLKSHIDIHGRRTDYGAIREDRYGATGRLNYRKKTAAGTLSAGYSRTVDQVERTGISTSNEVLDESLALSYGSPAFLSAVDVIPGSIVVTDENNLVSYSEGFDFRIEQQGNRTGIVALPGGLIAEGSQVLVDYRTELDGSLRYIADDQNIFVRHDFERYLKGFSIYGQRHESKACRVRSDADARILEYTDQSAGIRQDWRDFSASTEYQEYSDDLGGFDQWRTQVEGNHAIGRGLRAGWNAGYTQTLYDSRNVSTAEDRSRYYFAGAHLDGTFARNGFWKLEARTIKETGRMEQFVNGIVARIGFDWRRLSIEGGARYEEYEYFESERDRVQVFLSAKWRFRKQLAGGERK